MCAKVRTGMRLRLYLVVGRTLPTRDLGQGFRVCPVFWGYLVEEQPEKFRPPGGRPRHVDKGQKSVLGRGSNALLIHFKLRFSTGLAGLSTGGAGG